MNKEKEKKGLFELLFGSKKEKKKSCCGSFEIVELPEQESQNQDTKEPENPKKNGCCH